MLKNTCIIFIVFLSTAKAQIGTWHSYLSHNNSQAITAAQNKIYSISSSGVFYLDTKDNTIVTLSKTTGLSDVEPTSIKYDKTTNTLLIGYKNGNIDLLINQTIINIPDIKNKTNLGDKKINEIYFKNKLAYLSCGFGIVVLDLAKQEIKDTYFIGANGSNITINELTITPQYIYVATNNDVKRALLTSNNLGDFNNWETVNLPLGKYNTIASLGSKVYTNYKTQAFDSDTMYYYNDTVWTYFKPGNYADVNDINIINNKIFTAIEFKGLVYDTNHTVINDIFTYSSGGPNTAEIIEDDAGDIWIADKQKGLVWATNMYGSISYFPSGPVNTSVFNLEATNDVLYVSSGSINGNFDNAYNRNGVYKYNQNWFNFNKSTIPTLYDSIFVDAIDVTVATANKFYISTWGTGLFEFTNTSFIRYDTTNSALQGFNNTNEVKIGGTTIDKQGNLWIANARASNVIVVKTPQNKWYSYGVNYDDLKNPETIGDIIVDEQGFKWLTLGKTAGALVFDDNNTLDNSFDDRSQLLNFPNSVKVFSIVEDLKGYIWFGTEEGIYVNFEPHKIFSNPNVPGVRIVVSDGKFAENLLGNEKILDIAVDGANRKWMATENAGVFLISANGKEQIAHFTAENSPLLSNNVKTVAINQGTGEVFFGTDKGLISYIGTATEIKEDFSTALVFPNPVPENYTGNIGVKGLVAGSNVKITDLQGNLVFESEANGGQFSWNLHNFSGEKVVTGVYLIFVTNKTGEQTLATKILIK